MPSGLHQLNQALRFLLELAALLALAFWGWTTHTGLPRYGWAVGLPVAAGALWGVFRVPGDPGPAPVPVPGPVRLLLEVGLFTAAVGLLAVAGRGLVAGVLGGLLVVHYLLDRDRVRWLLGQ